MNVIFRTMVCMFNDAEFLSEMNWTSFIEYTFVNDFAYLYELPEVPGPFRFNVDWKMNTTEKPRIQKTAQKLVQKILFLIYCLSLYFYISFEDLTKRSTWFCPRVLSCPKRTCYSVSKTKAQFWERVYYLEKLSCHWPILSKKMGMSPSKWVYLSFRLRSSASSLYIPYNLLFSFVFLPRFYDGLEYSSLIRYLRGHSLITLIFFACFWPTKYPLVSIFTA